MRIVAVSLPDRDCTVGWWVVGGGWQCCAFRGDPFAILSTFSMQQWFAPAPLGPLKTREIHSAWTTQARGNGTRVHKPLCFSAKQSPGIHCTRHEMEAGYNPNPFHKWAYVLHHRMV